jgi:hypothetical protein
MTGAISATIQAGILKGQSAIQIFGQLRDNNTELSKAELYKEFTRLNTIQREVTK